MNNVLKNILIFLFLFVCQFAQADEIVLNNGDKIYGNIIEHSYSKIIIDSDVVGRISINKKNVSYFLTSKQKEKAVKREIKKIEKTKREIPKSKNKEREKIVEVEMDKWERKVSLGYSLASGNSESSQLVSDLKIKRKGDGNEWTIALNNYVSSSKGKMDAKKHNGSIRYAYSFGKDLKWYNFYKMEGNQDRFANIDYRVIPSAGFGYWFRNRDDFKLMAEAALGFEHVNYRDNRDDDNDAIFVPRLFCEKKILGDMRLVGDYTIYPLLTGLGEYRGHYDTSLINPITDDLSMKVGLISDYNSNPPDDIKKSDYKVMSSLEYSF